MFSLSRFYISHPSVRILPVRRAPGSRGGSPHSPCIHFPELRTCDGYPAFSDGSRAQDRLPDRGRKRCRGSVGFEPSCLLPCHAEPPSARLGSGAQSFRRKSKTSSIG